MTLLERSVGYSPAGRRIREAGERFQARQASAERERIESLLAERRAVLRRMAEMVEKTRRRKIARYRNRRPGRFAVPLTTITLAAIARQVCEKRGLTRIEFIAKRRSHRFVRARFEFMYRAYRETAKSMPQIGKFLGGMDHTSVLHGIRRYQELVESGEET